MKKGKTSKAKQDDVLDLSHLNETVEETERRRDAEANLSQLHGRNAASPNFDAPFAPGLGSAGVIPNNEDGDYRDSGAELRIDLGDGSIDGMSDLNDVSGNPQVYNGPAGDDLADLSEGGIGGMTIQHINDIEHGTGALPEEVKEHEAKRTAARVHFKKTEGNPLLEPAPRNASDDQRDRQRAAKRGTGGAVRSGATANNPASKNTKTETTINTKRGVGAKRTAEKDLWSKTGSKATVRNVGAAKSSKSSANKSTSKSASKKSSVKSNSGAAKKSGSKKVAAKKKAVKKSATKKSGVKKSSSRSTSSKKSAARKPSSKSSTKSSTKSSRSGSKRSSRTR